MEGEIFVVVNYVFGIVGIIVVVVIVGSAMVARGSERPDIGRVIESAISVVVFGGGGGQVELDEQVEDGDGAYDKRE